jgi:hypothetical protein
MAAEVVERLERNLMSLGVYVERHTVEREGDRRDGDQREPSEVASGEEPRDDPRDGEGPTLHVEYETAAAGLSRGDVGNVCTELVEAHGDGWEPVDCHFWVFGTDGGFLGSWEVRAGWFRALDRGDLSGTDFSTLVLSTRRPAEEPPAEMPAWGAASADP